ncbi:MAG: tRNA (adenosine(37)-N6)-dimethylallyltransferase MiaA [Candidatus Aminicenantia bacterium]
MKEKRKIYIAIVGPTAGGKSAISIEIAKEIGGEIINFDSTQLYKGFDIGTDKVPINLRKEVPHYFIDILSPEEGFSAAEFGKKAKDLMEELNLRGKIPILVGGTGLYYRVITSGIFRGPGRDENLRKRLEEEINIYGTRHLWEKLKEVDPDYAGKISDSDMVRIIRALEVYYLTSTPISEHFKSTENFLKDWEGIKIGLNLPRKKLYKRINERTLEMFKNGLLEEIKNLLSSGVREDAPPFRSIGYKWGLKAIKGEISIEKAIWLTQRDTRRYAKRQLTWFKKEKGIRWFSAENKKDIIEYVKKEILWKGQF